MTRQRKQRGFILHEAMMAVGLALVLVVGTTQLLLMVSQQQRLARQQVVADQAAGNLMEQIASTPWEETTSEKLASIALPEPSITQLPDANLSVDVVDEDPATRRITIAIEWQNAPGYTSESVRLVGWKFRAEEDAP